MISDIIVLFVVLRTTTWK